ncbi:hypothetical protein M0804_009968 [Polistes exclamans]|nr:hypothetical protein M0804_009968 [Polistes exclamans]
MGGGGGGGGGSLRIERWSSEGVGGLRIQAEDGDGGGGGGGGFGGVGWRRTGRGREDSSMVGFKGMVQDIKGEKFVTDRRVHINECARNPEGYRSRNSKPNFLQLRETSRLALPLSICLYVFLPKETGYPEKPIEIKKKKKIMK